MPLNDYHCEKCGFEAVDVIAYHWQDVECENCGEIMKKEISLPASRPDMTVIENFGIDSK